MKLKHLAVALATVWIATVAVIMHEKKKPCNGECSIDQKLNKLFNKSKDYTSKKWFHFAKKLEDMADKTRKAAHQLENVKVSDDFLASIKRKHRSFDEFYDKLLTSTEKMKKMSVAELNYIKSKWN